MILSTRFFFGFAGSGSQERTAAGLWSGIGWVLVKLIGKRGDLKGALSLSEAVIRVLLLRSFGEASDAPPSGRHCFCHKVIVYFCCIYRQRIAMLKSNPVGSMEGEFRIPRPRGI